MNIDRLKYIIYYVTEKCNEGKSNKSRVQERVSAW
ncbi:hypothetical protein EZN00_03059 [Clostridium tyrobutyricum]|jgi:hypothetical protein|nr:hypothetical protein EZN00_03059 [Clostridium tyrobutyricum]